MKRQTMVRLCLAMFLLASVLGFGFGGSEANAAPCCTFCDSKLYWCLQGQYYYTYCNGDYSCCDQAVDSCYRYCSFSC
jgi:hypothetical protein